MSKQTTKDDPFSKPSMPLSNRLARALWGVFYIVLFRPSPRPFHSWRAMLLRTFGAKIGPECHIYRKAEIWAPWNLTCEDHVWVADGAIIYNPKPIKLMSHAVVSQDAYLCGATHDYDDPAFPMISAPITIEAYAWICARATVLMGVTVQKGAVLALGSITSKDLQAWSIYAGIPAKKIKDRAQPKQS